MHTKTKSFLIAASVLVFVLTFVGYSYNEGWLFSAAVMRRNAPEVNERLCRRIKRWFDQGVLTSNHRRYLPHAQRCAQEFPEIWYANQENRRNARNRNARQAANLEDEDVPAPTRARCRRLKRLFEQGTLSDNPVQARQAELCARNHRDIWFD